MLSHLQELKTRETLLSFIHLFYKQTVVEAQPVSRQQVVAFGFIAALHQRHAEERTVAFYADLAHLSPNHFTRIVKAETNRTPSEWIATLTIQTAKELLRRNDLSIKEVAEQLHFPEQFTFRKYFKQHTGLSPKAYRAQQNDVKEHDAERETAVGEA